MTPPTTTMPEPEKIRIMKLRLDETAHATILRAIVLRLALDGETEADDDEIRAGALYAVCRDWLRTQAELLREARP